VEVTARHAARRRPRAIVTELKRVSLSLQPHRQALTRCDTDTRGRISPNDASPHAPMTLNGRRRTPTARGTSPKSPPRHSHELSGLIASILPMRVVLLQTIPDSRTESEGNRCSSTSSVIAHLEVGEPLPVPPTCTTYALDALPGLGAPIPSTTVMSKPMSSPVPILMVARPPRCVNPSGSM
jgi:hypothetical protein